MLRTVLGRSRRLRKRVFAALWVLGLVAAVAWAAEQTSPPPAQGGRINLLYHSDVAGKIEECGCQGHPVGGLARRATYLDAVLNEGAPVLLVDAGGLFGGRDKLEREQTRFVCEVTAGFGYDALGLGPSDLHYGLAFLREMIAKNTLPFTNANVRDRASGALILPPYLIVQKGSTTFGICSVLDPTVPLVRMAALDEAYEVADPLATLRALLPELRKQVQTVVLLSQLDVAGTAKLLRELSGIDIAIAGHTLQALPGEQIVDKSVMLAAGFEGRAIGRLSGEFDAGGRLRAFQVKLTELSRQIADDPVIAARVAQFKAEQENRRLETRGSHLQVKGTASQQFLTQYECRKCHEDIYAQVTASRHGVALASLARKGMAQEPDCLVCHTTGYEYHGGYDERPPANRLANVQCEACHGYGSRHRRDGRWRAEARMSCVGCHDRQNSPRFEYASYWARIRH